METIEHNTNGSPSRETVDIVKQLLDEISSTNGEHRAAAETKLQSMGSEAALVIGTLLEARIEKSREGLSRVRKLKPWTIAYAMLLFVIGIVAVRSHQWPNAIGISLLPFPVLAAAVVVILVRSISPPPSAWIDALMTLSDKRMIPILLDCYGLLAVNVEKLFSVLTRLLPTLDASDQSLLNSEQRGRLNHFLAFYAEKGTRYPPEFVVSVLKALAAIGDVKSVAYVKRVAKMKRNASVLAAARDCLESLQARVEATGNQLLRAASNDAPDDELMRPVQSGTTDAAEQLLRAADESKAEGDL